jgi:hypothetical protein
MYFKMDSINFGDRAAEIHKLLSRITAGQSLAPFAPLSQTVGQRNIEALLKRK